MKFGLGAAITWALDTVILSIALANAAFFSTELAIALAAFVSTFLHDACSAIYMWIYMGVKRQLGNVKRALFSKAGKWMLLASILGAPIGMTGYVLAINNIGASYTAAISAFFPALGAVLSYFFLKEKMKGYQWVGLLICLTGVAVLGYSPDESVPGSWPLGVAGALVCTFGWALEAVVMAYCMKGLDIGDEHALLIRQTTSMVTYALIILPVLGGWIVAVDVISTSAMPVIALSALLGTVSYLCYYKAIVRIGAAKSMALNITYSAWAIPLSLLLLGTMPTSTGVVCAIVIILGSIMASTDVKHLLSRNSTEAGETADAAAAVETDEADKAAEVV